MRLACAMMVGAGESTRYLDRMLRYASEWASVICVYADGADPDTLAAIRHAAGAVALRAEPDSVYETGGEGAARNRMFELLDAELDHGDLVVNLDADEQLVDAGTTLLRAQAEPRAVCWHGRYLHLWNREGTVYRVDGLWHPDVRAAAWRHGPGGRTEAGAMFAESAPAWARARRVGKTELTIHHWGYAHAEDRAAKSELYLRRDGGAEHNVDHLHSIAGEAAVASIGGR